MCSSRDVVEIDRLLLPVVGTNIYKRPGLRSGGQHSFREDGCTRLILKLIVEEEEQPVLDDRSAEVCAEVIRVERLLPAQTRQARGQVGVVLVRVRIERAVVRLPESAAMKLVRTPLRGEAQRHGAFSSRIGGQVAGGYRYLVDRADAQSRRLEEPRGRGAKTLKIVVRSVNADADRAIGHGVIRGEAQVTANLGARDELGKRQHVATVQREVLNRVGSHRSRQSVGGRLENFA